MENNGSFYPACYATCLYLIGILWNVRSAKMIICIYIEILTQIFYEVFRKFRDCLETSNTWPQSFCTVRHSCRTRGYWGMAEKSIPPGSVHIVVNKSRNLMTWKNARKNCIKMLKNLIWNSHWNDFRINEWPFVLKINIFDIHSINLQPISALFPH